jgi:hypothetical protein
MVWSADPAIEAHLATTRISGAVARTADPYAGLALVNAGGD